MSPTKNPKTIPGFGANFKREVRRWYGTRVSLSAHGEMLPSPNKFVELDKTVVDKWGMPVLKIHHPFDDNDRKMFQAHAADLRRDSDRRQSRRDALAGTA